MPLLQRIANLFRQSRIDREIEAEMRAHIEMRTADNVSEGMAPEEARRDALVRFGNRVAMREKTASADMALALERVGRDARFAWRQLRRSPGFASTAIGILAVGIGASTAIFSAVNPILFEPLPYPHPGRIITISDTSQGERIETTYGTYRELAARSRAIETLATFEPWQPVLTGTQTPERPDGQSVTSGYFRMLGVAPARGRDFEPSDEIFNGPKVVILSDSLWRNRFASDPAILGRAIKLNDDAYTVIGVMPRDFENVLLPTAGIWTPMRFSAAALTNVNSGAWGHHQRMAGRLRAGASLDEARRELQQIANYPEAEFPRPEWASMRNGFIVASLQQDMVREVKPALLAVLGAVALVLLIACVNVTGLLLARGAQRRGEFSMRATLGASKSQLIRQSLTESLLLAAVGGVFGMGVAAAGVKALIMLSPPGLPRVHAIGLDLPVFLFAFGVTLLAGVAAGLIPALESLRVNLREGMLSTSRGAAGSRQTARSLLVVSEVALALILLVGAGLLLRSMQRLLAVDPGFNTDDLLTMQVQTAGHKFDDLASAPDAGDATRRRFFADALDEVRRVPGVTSAAFTSYLPLSDDPPWAGLYGAHFENQEGERRREINRYVISPAYFQAMQIPLKRGRVLDERDTAQAPFAAVISESLARSQFPGQDAIGKRLQIGPPNRPWYTVVGIAGDVRQTSIALSEPDAVYITPGQSWFADEALSLVARTNGDAAALAPAIRDAIWRVDKDQPVLRVTTMRRLLDVSLSQRLFVLVLFEAFGLVALLLAATGLYGVLASSVAERTREIGVRTALGASRSAIVSMVLAQGLRFTGAGIAIGLTGALLASRAMTALLYGVSPLDPATYSGVSVLLAGVAVVACVAPARRAASIDPMEALRSE